MRYLIAVIILLIAPYTSSADKYVVDGGSGGCSSWSDACDQISTALSSVSRGETIWVGDGTYSAFTANVAESSTTVITIKKATASEHGAETGWSSTYGDGQATLGRITVTTGFWTIDGATRDEDDWQDGDSYGFKSTPETFIYIPWKDPLYDIDNIITKYVYFVGGGEDGDGGTPNDNVFIYNYGSGTEFQRCYFYNSSRCHIFIVGSDNGVIEYSYFYLNESVPAEHSESIALEYSANTWDIRYNVFDTCEGTTFILGAECDNIKVYGNVFKDSEWMGNGVFDGWSHTPMGSGALFYNNTVANVGNPRIGVVGSSGVTSYNNIFFEWTTDAPAFSGTHDYNAFSGGNDYGEANGQSGITSSVFTEYSTGDLTLSGTGDVIDNGTPLAVNGYYDYDLLGTDRDADDGWDIGAYEYTSGTPGEVPANAIQGVTIN